MLSSIDIRQIENVAKLWWTKNENKKIPCALYARRSTEDKDETSIPDQLRLCREYAKEAQVLEIIGEYSDEDRSGMFSDNRESFLSMMDEIHNGKVKVVIVYSLDRLARKMTDGLVARDEILAKGGLVLSTRSGESFERDASGELTRRLFMTFFQYLPESTAEAVMRHSIGQAQKGLNAGGQPPYGYTTISGTGEFAINEDEKPAVEYMFQAILQGKSYNTISKDLASLGYLTRETKNRKPGPFSKSTILGMLTNPKYKGLYIYNKVGAKKKKHRVLVKEYDEVRSKIPAIVSEEDWDKVQQIIETRANNDVSNGHGDYPLTGLLFCDCGQTMHGSACVGGRAKKRYRRYICSTKRSKGQCKSTPINADTLELGVANVIAPIVTDLLRNANVQNCIAKKVKSNISTLLTVNQKQLNRLEKRYKDALVGLGRLDEEEAEMAKDEISQMRNIINERKQVITDLKSKANQSKTIITYLKNGVEITGKDLLECDTVFRALATSLIERITVSKQEIQIQFKNITQC